jgi:hypothetical protein
MVSQYEKYCNKCAKKYRQDETFWKEEPNASELYRNPMLNERELHQDYLAKKSPIENVKGKG